MLYNTQNVKMTLTCVSCKQILLDILLTVSIVSCLFYPTSAKNDTCGPGLQTPGVTYPKGDITIEVGNPLEIYCSLNGDIIQSKNRNSSDLLFYHNEREVPQQFISIVNETTIRLYIHEPPASSSMYYCYLKTLENEIKQGKSPYAAVCLNKVFVGTKPQEVKNFSCISQNWQNLTCSWQQPENYVTTKYKLRFYLPGRAGRKAMYGCPSDTDERENFCFWNETTAPVYRLPYEYYMFSFFAQNTLGTNNFTYKFHHYAHVIPAMPEKLTVVNTTPYSALLNWTSPFPMSNFPPGIQHKVEYQSEYDNADKWYVADTSLLSKNNDTYSFNLTGLPYAFTMYDVRVYIKSAIADDNMWSVPAASSFQTASTVPDAPPKTDIGSFEVITGITRDVYIYWQQIKEEYRNGDNFSYKIVSVEESDVVRNLSPFEISKSHAKFKNINHNSYNFTIASYNSVGFSKSTSFVYVPSSLSAPKEPRSFTKISYGKGIYELSWKPPLNDKHIVSYTLFWCNYEYERSVQCTGRLNWTHIPRDITIQNITVNDEKPYQFAVSANTNNASSGMVWASCTVIHNRGVGKMKSVWINHISSTSIDVGWKLDCSERIGTVKGYVVRYCPIVSPFNMSCKIPADKKFVAEDFIKITELKPYTTYAVTVAVIASAGINGSESDPLYNTTLEAAPETIPELNITNVTNTSLSVSWKPPVNTNGVLRFYYVYYSNDIQKVENTQTEIQLFNLTAYHLYNISVSACTVACSEIRSVSVRTAIGSPGVMLMPHITVINESWVFIKYNKPQNAAGPVDYYQIRVQQSDSKENLSRDYNTSNTKIQLPVCKDGLHLKVSVRAVNYRNNIPLFGPWSDTADHDCNNPGLSHETKILLWVLGVLLVFTVLAVFVYLFRQLYQCCQKMKDIKVKLPPGLKILVTDDSNKEKVDQIIDWPKSDNTDISSKSHLDSADEKLLLEKKESENGSDHNGDSSGCSTGGHDSASSSITSDTRMSSDSGTEVEQKPSNMSECMFDTSPPSHIRQRPRHSFTDFSLPFDKGLGDISMPRAPISSAGAHTSPYLNMCRNDKSDLKNPENLGYMCVGQKSLPVTHAESTGIPGKKNDYVSVSKMMGMSSPPIGNHKIEGLTSQENVGNYISHSIPWSSTKGTLPSGGYVLAGDVSRSGQNSSQSLPSKGYVLTGEALKTDLTQENDSSDALLKNVDCYDSDLEDTDCLDRANVLADTISKDMHPCELELRTFGSSDTGGRDVCTAPQFSPKSNTGYVVLADTSTNNAAKQKKECSNYVPHGQFESTSYTNEETKPKVSYVEKPYTVISAGFPPNNG